MNIGDSSILRVNANGSLAIDPSNLNPAYNKSESVNHFLNQAGIWIVAEDASGNYYTSVHHYKGLDSVDFYPGPVDTFTGQAADISEWNIVWKNSKEDIEFHKSFFDYHNYTGSDFIKNWPAQGKDGYSRYLAPFVDHNSNGVYDPENGDYPYVKGDHSVYCIYNDLAFEHKASLGVEIGLEVHMQAYTYNDKPNTVFLEYFIIKRGTKAISNLKVGFFMDGRCGNDNDNFAGTDVKNNAIYMYNGDADDEGYFGTNIPFVSAQFLNQKLDNSIAFNSSQDINGKPIVSSDYKHYMNSLWRDSSDLTYGNLGMNSGNKTAYIYSQDYFVNEDVWSEESAGNSVGKRNIIGVHDFGNFTAQSVIKLDVALSSGTQSPQSSLTIKELIKNQIEDNKSKFDATTSIDEIDEISLLDIYPNPLSTSFTLSCKKEPITELLITNNQGVIVFSENDINKMKFTCNVSLPTGIYYAVVKTQNHIFTKPLIVNR